MYEQVSKNTNHKVNSHPPFCHSRESGNLSSQICRGAMNCAPTGYLLLITGYCILYAMRSTLVQLPVILAVNLILYEVPLIDSNLLQMVHQLMDMLLFGF